MQHYCTHAGPLRADYIPLHRNLALAPWVTPPPVRLGSKPRGGGGTKGQHTNVVPLAPSQLRTLSSDSRAQLVAFVRRAAPALRQQSPAPQSTALLGSGARRASSLARAPTQPGCGLILYKVDPPQRMYFLMSTLRRSLLACVIVLCAMAFSMAAAAAAALSP